MAKMYVLCGCYRTVTNKARKQPFDTALAALGHPHRRQLLVALLDHNPQADDSRDPLGILEGADEPDVIEVKLIHNHLPKLEEMGYISWNRATNELSKGPEWDEVKPVVELIHAHHDELPDGWL